MNENAKRVWNGDGFVDESPMTQEQLREALADIKPLYSIIKILEGIQ